MIERVWEITRSVSRGAHSIMILVKPGRRMSVALRGAGSMTILTKILKLTLE